MTNANNKRNDRIADDEAMIAGVQKFLAQFATLPVGATNVTPRAPAPASPATAKPNA